MKFVNPSNTIIHLGLTHGMSVADVGAGAGAWTLAAAEQVGDDGKVVALEIRKELVSKIQALAEETGYNNVEVLWADVEREGGTKLKDNSMDALIVSNLLFQIQDKETFAGELGRILREKGKMLVVGWSDSHGGVGPANDDVVREEAAKELFSRHSFRHDEDVPAADHHYAFVMRYES